MSTILFLIFIFGNFYSNKLTIFLAFSFKVERKCYNNNTPPIIIEINVLKSCWLATVYFVYKYNLVSVSAN